MSDFTISTQASQTLQQAKMEQQTNALKGHQGKMDAEKARKVAVDFEAMFLSQMLRPMFEGIKIEEPFGGGQAEEMWQNLIVEEYGKAMAQSGGIGIADQIQREMLKMQEVQ